MPKPVKHVRVRAPRHLSTARDTAPLILDRQEQGEIRPHSHNARKAAREPRTWSER